MPAPGRNDPCPCGSGKKYKHCCLTRAQAATGITRADRTAAMDALARYIRHGDFEAVVGESALAWAADDFGDDAQAALQAIADQETSLNAYFEWLFFDVRLEDGRTVASWFLEARAHTINPRAADYIRLMQDTHLRPFQIRRVRSDAGFEVRDLWSGDERFIDERAATSQLVVWDVLVARIVEHPDGTHQMEGTPLLLPPAAASGLVKDLKAEHRAFMREDPGGAVDVFFKRHAPVFHHYWYDLVALRRPLDARTPEGDPVTVSELVFDVPRAGEAWARLLQEPDFEADEGISAAWMEPDTHPRRLLGNVTCDQGTLTLVTFSRERAARGRARLEATLGPLVLKSELHHEPGSGPPPDAWASDEDDEDDEAAPSAEDVPEIQEWLAEQDRKWLDLSIPALDGQTPREAARDRRMRPRLKNLLIEIENREARAGLHGGGRDVTWMWKELGLRRP